MFKLKSLTILLVTPQANKLRQVVRAKTSNFIRKANRAGRWCISVPKKCLAWVWMLGTFIKQRGSAKEAKLEKVTPDFSICTYGLLTWKLEAGRR